MATITGTMRDAHLAMRVMPPSTTTLTSAAMVTPMMVRTITVSGNCSTVVNDSTS